MVSVNSWKNRLKEFTFCQARSTGWGYLKFNDYKLYNSQNIFTFIFLWFAVFSGITYFYLLNPENFLLDGAECQLPD